VLTLRSLAKHIDLLACPPAYRAVCRYAAAHT
jgi:hypothetical protein